MEATFQVKNVKCGGCATRIQQGLSELAGVITVDVEIAAGKVVVNGEAFAEDVLVKKLDELGYPVLSD